MEYNGQHIEQHTRISTWNWACKNHVSNL